MKVTPKKLVREAIDMLHNILNKYYAIDPENEQDKTEDVDDDENRKLIKKRMVLMGEITKNPSHT